MYSLQEIVKSPSFVDFNVKMKSLSLDTDLNHTMIGFNYRNNQIISTKFYYVFYEDLALDCLFPIMELKEYYKKYIEQRSEFHFKTKLTSGGGLTFTIKYDEQLNVTRGFFFRLTNNNETFVNRLIRLYPEFNFNSADFESGYGQYVLYNQEGVKTSEYLYLKSTEKLVSIEDKYGISLSETNCIEISSARENNTADHKFIAMGGAPVMKENFKKNIPESIKNIITGTELQFCCPAFTNEEKYSIYIIGKIENSKFSCSPIDIVTSVRETTD